MADTHNGSGGSGPGKVATAAKRLDQHPKLLTAVKFMRELLPGDSRFGDPLSTAGRRSPEAVGRQVSRLTAERPGVLREASLSALQVWQELSEARGRGRGHQELTIVFTDLAGFSDWALRAGDDAALELLRDVGQVFEPPVRARDGEVVKWLGDGMMAVFGDPQDALDATFEACAALAGIEADGYQPRVRAGLHRGRPRKVGGDYLGIDVNVAARVADEASPGEVLVSDRVLAEVDTDGFKVRKRRLVGVKGVPREVTAYALTPK